MNVSELLANIKTSNASVVILPCHSGVKVVLHDTNDDFTNDEQMQMLVTEATLKAAGKNLDSVLSHGIQRMFTALERRRLERGR